MIKATATGVLMAWREPPIPCSPCRVEN